jgi:aminopeptidase N
MPAARSLTRSDAVARAATVRLTATEVELDLRPAADTFRSTARLRFSAAPGGATFADVRPATLLSATLNGTDLDPSADFDAEAGRLQLRELAADNELVVIADMAYSHDGEGLHRHVDPADGRVYLYAMSFLDAAPRWFACFDQPDLKAPVSLDVRCPPDWLVSGNGPASEIETGHWHIAPTGPLSTYFTTLVAGPYHAVRDTHDGIALVLLARQSLAEPLDRDAAGLFAHTKHCFDGLHALFGVRYPWGEYHQAFVPEFNAGAMENPGCVTFRDQLVFRSKVTESDRLDRELTIAHEMAHMWFGDLVTMRWWDDLWLNESFAEYLGHRVTGEHSWVLFGAARKSWGHAADRRPSTHPVAGNGAPDAASALSEFDGISYAKGASVLRQLAAHLRDGVFLDGLRRYIRAHADGNAEFADLIAAWTAAGATDLETWTQSWLRTTGLDELSVHDGAVVRHSPAGTPRTHSIAVGAYAADGTRTSSNRVVVAAERTPAGLDRGGVALPDVLDETWAKLVLPEDTWSAMPALLTGIDDARTRVAIWNALRLATADAELDPALAVDIVTAALPVETDDAVVSRVGRWARTTLIDSYLDGAGRAAALARLAGAMLAVVDVAAPGSGRQLAAARTAIATTSDAALLRGWLSGAGSGPNSGPDSGPNSGPNSGLVVDAELRWSILLRLARIGELTAEAIDEEAARDHSTQGGVHAARCHAARPGDEAKRTAWDALMRDAGRPNHELYAIAEGFWDPDQRGLTDPYVARYFEQIAATARLRSGWVVDQVALLAYPWTAVDAASAAATQRLLADDSLDPGIRRSVTDAGDDLRRALAVRDRFGG